MKKGREGGILKCVFGHGFFLFWGQCSLDGENREEKERKGGWERIDLRLRREIMSEWDWGFFSLCIR